MRYHHEAEAVELVQLWTRCSRGYYWYKRRAVLWQTRLWRLDSMVDRRLGTLSAMLIVVALCATLSMMRDAFRGGLSRASLSTTGFQRTTKSRSSLHVVATSKHRHSTSSPLHVPGVLTPNALIIPCMFVGRSTDCVTSIVQLIIAVHPLTTEQPPIGTPTLAELRGAGVPVAAMPERRVRSEAFSSLLGSLTTSWSLRVGPYAWVPTRGSTSLRDVDLAPRCITEDDNVAWDRLAGIHVGQDGLVEWVDPGLVSGASQRGVDDRLALAHGHDALCRMPRGRQSSRWEPI
jgi:hypothetical protein